MTALPEILSPVLGEWLVLFHEHQVGFGFSRLHDKGGDVVAEVVVDNLYRTGASHFHGPLHLNLLSQSGQESLTRSLAKRDPSTPWLTYVPQACAIAVGRHRIPSPTINTSEVVVRPRRYVLPRLMPAYETTLVYGDAESCKSLLAQMIAICVRGGHELPWGGTPLITGPVLYLDYETNDEILVERLDRLAHGMGLPKAPNLFYRGLVTDRRAAVLRPLGDELEHISAMVDREGIVLIIVDSVGFATPGKLVDDEVARQVMGDLRQLGNVSKLGIAHVSKEVAGGTSAARLDPFGSMFFRAGMRSGIGVTRAAEGSDASDQVTITVQHAKDNDGLKMPRFGLDVCFADGRGPISMQPRNILQIAGMAEKMDIYTRLRHALSGGGKSTTDLARELDMADDDRKVRRALESMSDVWQISQGGGRGNPAVWGLRAVR